MSAPEPGRRPDENAWYRDRVLMIVGGIGIVVVGLLTVWVYVIDLARTFF